MRHAQLVEVVGRVGREGHRLGEAVHRLVVAAEATQRVPQLGVHARVLVEVTERDLVGVDRLLVLRQRLVLLGDLDVTDRELGLERDGARVRGDRVLRLLQARAGLAEELVRLRDRRVSLEANGVPQRARRLLRLVHAKEGRAPREEVVPALGGELGRALVAARRLLPLLEAQVRAARALEGEQIVRPQHGDVVVGLAREIVALQLHRQLGERELHVEVPRLQIGGLREGIARAREDPLLLVRETELVVCVEVVGLDLRGTRQGLDGVVELAELLVGLPELEPLVGVVGFYEETRLEQVDELLKLLGHRGNAQDIEARGPP